MDRREFLKRGAALLVALQLPADVLRQPALGIVPRWYGGVRPLSAWELALNAGDQSRGETRLWRGANPVPLLHFTVGRCGALHWYAQVGREIIWTPDLHLEVRGGAMAALPFQDRVLLASDAGQQWLSLRRGA